MEMPSKEILLKLYRELITARRGEQRMFEISGPRVFPTGHRGPGEEVVPIAICNNLTETDCFHPNFRTAFCLFTKPGFTLTDTIAMYLGKFYKNIPFFAPKHGTFGSSGTLGEPAVMYLGAAVANVIQKTGDVTVFVQGDGASNRAPTHEAMVVAAAWQLPIVFVIQNNQYGMGTSVEKAYNIKDLSLRGVGYGFPSEQVDGNDMIAMYQVAKKHIDNVRNGGGPSLIAANTYRFRAHYEGDPQHYRPNGEQEEWQKTKDPIPRYEKQLMEMGILTRADADRIEKEVDADIEAAIETVQNLPKISGSEPSLSLAVDGI
jgi:TPP-dependent pyruvate/acetoin dehydrogenase alpha subunit